MTPRIYHDGALPIESEISLSQSAKHHLVKVLRSKPGDSIELFNGDGHCYQAKLITVSNRKCTAQINTSTFCNNESPLNITLLQGLSRNHNMDTTLQKATELGVDTIVPVICAHSRFKMDSDRLLKKMAHWRQIIISACEQSGRCTLPHIHEPEKLETAMLNVDSTSRLVFTPDTSQSLSDAAVSDAVSILIGPESGLTDNELDYSRQHGFSAVRFGPRVLRTETAGPAAIAVIQNRWGDLY